MIKPQRCPECGKKYIYFDMHWKSCAKNPEALPSRDTDGGEKVPMPNQE